MSNAVSTVYWDTSVFLCFLSAVEQERRAASEAVLRDARDGRIKIVTSMVTLVEVIRPKGLPHPVQLTPEQQSKLEAMFRWPWLSKISVHEKVAMKAVEIARNNNLKPMDAIHAATAILAGVDEFQKWDKDYSKVSMLLNVTEPRAVSEQPVLIDVHKPIGPSPEDFTSEPSSGPEQPSSQSPGDGKVSVHQPEPAHPSGPHADPEPPPPDSSQTVVPPLQSKK